MADDVELEEETTDVDDGTGTDDGGDSAGGGEGDEKPEKPAEPFLKIDDRTVYKDPDSAKQGWQHLNGQLAAYRRHGRPEEIERRLTEAKAREDLLETLKTGTKVEQARAEERYLDTLAPEKKRAWEASRQPIRELLSEDLGKIGKLEQEIADLKKARETDKQEREGADLQRFRKRALGELDGILEASGKTLTEIQKKRLQQVALAAMQDQDDPEGQELLQALNAEDAKTFATIAARIHLGEEAIKPVSNGHKNGAGGDDRPRDPETGKFLSEEQIAARKKAAAADKASRLAKAPPEGGSAASEQGGKKEMPAVGKRAGLFAQALKAARGQ